jgi:hypothetical protein
MAIQTLNFTLPDGRLLVAPIARAIAAGYTGRDPALVQAHVDELAEQGIPAPSRIPMLFPLLPTLVTNAETIAVLGEDSTPEIEVALFRINGTDYVTVASDQTDRVLEVQSITVSKNVCPKIVGKEAWAVAEVREHWRQLQLTARCGDVVLQTGTLDMMMAPEDILAFVAEHDGPEAEGRLVFSGTVPTDEVPPKGDATIALELSDPVLKRSIRHAYRLTCLAEYFG